MLSRSRASGLVCLFLVVALLASMFPAVLPTASVHAASSPLTSSAEPQSLRPEPLIDPYIDPVRLTLEATIGEVIDPWSGADNLSASSAFAGSPLPSIPQVALPDPMSSLPPQLRAQLSPTATLDAPRAQDSFAQTAPAEAVSAGAPPIPPAAVAPPAAKPLGPPLPPVGDPQAPRPPPVSPSRVTSVIFVPIIHLSGPGGAPERDEVQARPEAATSLRSSDGILELRIPPGAVDRNTTIRYNAAPIQDVAGYQEAGIFFELTASDAQGNPVNQFAKPLTLVVNYPSGLNIREDRLRLYFFDEALQRWVALPTTVQREQRLLIASTDHFTLFAVLSTTVDSCADIDWRNLPVDLAPLFRQTCERIGLGTMGDPIGNPFLLGGSNTWVQEFANGSIVSRPDPPAAFYMAGLLYEAYRNATNELRNRVGAPIADSATTAPETYHDESHDFRNQPFIALERGFVARNGLDGSVRVYLPYPEFRQITVTSSRQTRRDENQNEITEAQLQVAAEVDPAPDVMQGIDAQLQLVVEFDDGTTWVASREIRNNTGIFTGEFTYDQLLPLTRTLSISLTLTRINDGLIGYAPCHYYDHQQPYTGFTLYPGTVTITVDCQGGSSGDFLPPTIEFLEVWPDGQGNLSVKVLIVDDSGEIASASINGNPGRLDPELRSTPEFGENIYSAVFRNVPPNQIVNFTVTASDPAGNTATASGSSRVTFRGRNGFACANPCMGHEVIVGNPVLPGLGNKVEPLPVLFVAGPGEANIDLTLIHNSQDPTIGLTGQGWTFPYQINATRRDNLLLRGYEVMYPDGRQVLFAETSDGRFVSRSPDVHDRLERRGTTLILTTKSLTSYEFDSSGRLIAQRDRNGNALRFAYNGDRLVSITNDAGRTVMLTYNAQGLISAISAPEGKQYSFSYEGTRLVGFTNARGYTTTFTYQEQYLGTLLDVNGRPYEATVSYLASVRNPAGNLKNRQVYDDRGRVIEQWIGEREHRVFSYDDDARITTITDAFGRVTTYHYDELYRLTQITYPDGLSEFFTYDERFNRTSFTDRMGRVYTFTYDERGNRLSEVGPLGWQRSWAYNERDQVTQFTDAEGRITRYEYDDRGNLIRVIDPANNVSVIRYDARGLPVEVIDFNGNRITNVYDPTTGDLVAMTNGVGDQTQFGYDDLGRLRAVTNGRGFTTRYIFDANDNLMQVDGPLGFVLRYQYDQNDNLIAAIDANGGVSRFGYDQADYLVGECTPLGHCVSFAYDEMNNLIRVTDAENRVWTFAYDAVNNRVAAHGPEQSHAFYRYDAVGNLTALIRCNSPLVNGSCAVQRAQELVYDELNRVTRVIANAVPGAPASADTNVVTSFSYDRVGNIVSITDPNGNTSRFAYDALNRLVRIETAAGQVTTYTYDSGGNLVRFTNPRGFSTTFAYDAANRLVSVTDALNQTTSFRYDANGNLIASIDPAGIVTAYRYDALDRLEALIQNERPGAAATSTQNVTTRFAYDLAGNLRFVFDPRGRYVTEYQYDADMRLTRIIDAEGGVTTFAYDRVDNIVAVTDANGHTTTYRYDGLDRPVQITNPEGHAVRFVYDQLNNLIQITDARGFTSTYAYDGLDRVVRFTDNLGGVWRYQYDAAGNLLARTDANGQTTGYAYDVAYRLISRADAEGYVTRWSYDLNDNLLTYTDGNGNTSSLTYDALDRMVTYTNPENETTAYRYDWMGNLTARIEADGVVTGYGYDSLYRLNSVTFNQRSDQPAGAAVNVTTRYQYDEVGNLVLIRDANGNLNSFAYDGLNRVIQEVDALGNIWRYAYDHASNLIERIDALRNRTRYSYYPDDRLARIDYHDGTFVAYAYDENNNVLTVTNELGTTERRYDPLNRLIEERDVHGRQTRFSYDAVGNRIGLTYPDGRTVRSSYLKNNWLASTIDPEGRETRYIRDGVGNLVRQENPNNTVTVQTFDKANRILSVENRQNAGAGTVNSRFVYTYDEVGQRVTMAATYAWRNPSVVTTSYTYDPLRRLVRHEDSQGRWTEYTFDAVGNRLTMTTNDSGDTNRPFDAKTLSYSYNAINQLLTVVSDTRPGQPGLKRTDNSAQAMHAFRHEVSAQRGKGISETAADVLLTQVDALLTQLYSKPAPNVATVESVLNALRDQVESYQAAGDLRNQGIATSLLAKLRLASDANRGLSGELQAVTYTYDANGNRINKEFPGPQGPRIQGTDYRYDAENRLIAVQDYQQNLQGNRVDRALTTMARDGDGRRMVKTYDPKTGGGGLKRVEYVYDGLDPIAEYNAWNPQYDNYYRGAGGRILQRHHFPTGAQGQSYWYHYDGLGSVAGLTRHAGQSSHNYRYQPYGEIELPQGNFTDPHNHYTFTGQEWNEHTGLYEFYARHYDPDTGTWLTQDPYRGQIRDPRSLHRYQYVYNSP
ncbi:RHS repeat-associated core domain-containing protein, partial [uncultured Chloroflexus sp.]|uniref:RHS repeat-associated core domain-containing protein n=1 Tax=uncultured Chloroflexus sp. TaxID=214040 RepID=UPI002609FF6C